MVENGSDRPTFVLTLRLTFQRQPEVAVRCALHDGLGSRELDVRVKAAEHFAVAPA